MTFILYNIPERAMEKKCYPVDNHVRKGDKFYYRPLRNVILILLNRTFTYTWFPFYTKKKSLTIEF